MLTLLESKGYASITDPVEFGADQAATDAVVEQILADSLTAHNPTYTFSSLPTKENFAVLLKAWANVEWARAGRGDADQFNMNSPQGGGDKSQMMTNHITLAKELESRYVTECERLGIGLGGDEAAGVQVGTMYRTDPLSDRHVPDIISPPPAAVTLADAANITGTTLDLSWTESRITDFNYYKIYRHTVAGLKDLTTLNTDGAKYLGIIDAATEVETVYRRYKIDYRVTGLLPGTTYYFVVMVGDRNNRVSISNEISAVTT